jgi:hypothetical protein
MANRRVTAFGFVETLDVVKDSRTSTLASLRVLCITNLPVYLESIYPSPYQYNTVRDWPTIRQASAFDRPWQVVISPTAACFAERGLQFSEGRDLDCPIPKLQIGIHLLYPAILTLQLQGQFVLVHRNTLYSLFHWQYNALLMPCFLQNSATGNLPSLSAQIPAIWLSMNFDFFDSIS